MVVNGLVAAGIGVRLSNRALSFAHPVPLTPPSFAFAIWGVIYALVGAFCVVQVVPKWVADPTYVALRPWVALALVSNCGWLFLFGWELFWLAFVVIVVYLVALYWAVFAIDLNVTDTRAPSYGLRLLALLAFSSNAAWVTVATLLQLQVNLLDEGYFLSEGLTVAMLCAAIAIASYRALAWADAAWVAISAWALGTISSNQLPGSDWGCLASVCDACAEGAQHICTNARAPPLGWANACAKKLPTSDECVLERSPAVRFTCLVEPVCL